MTGATGTCSVIANQAGNSTYAAAAQVTKSANATTATQTITFTTNPPASAAYNASFTVAAKASSGLAVTFTSSGACSNSGATYTMTSATGTCSVIANQAGNPDYTAAPQVTKSVTATKAHADHHIHHQPFGVGHLRHELHGRGDASQRACGDLHQFRGMQQFGRSLHDEQGTGTCSVIANQAGNPTTRQHRRLQSQ